MMGEESQVMTKLVLVLVLFSLFVCFYVYECFAQHIYLCMVSVHGTLGGQKKGIILPGSEVTSGCGPLCGCWELNQGALEEQSMFLTTKPTLQPQNC